MPTDTQRNSVETPAVNTLGTGLPPPEEFLSLRDILIMILRHRRAIAVFVLLATLAAAMQFTELSNVVLVWAVFGAGQLIEGMVITPWLVGERIGLHPLAVIFALLAFGQLFGFFGLLLALPLSAILLVALRYARAWYLASTMYQKS